uniref:F-box domain-containing protein n=1 Tax=Aegilops tauschii TaxID=37682 RepID=M8B0T2_AEGTA
MQSPSKMSVVSTSISPVVSGLQGWADLPDGPLHSIVALLGSSIDILAFAATCHSWRAAFSSYRSTSNLCTLIPPLLIRPAGPIQGSSLPSIFSEKCSSVPENSRYMLRVRKVIDVASNNSTLRCQIPQETFENMHFAGSSHGHLICCYRGECLVVDVFTGAMVWPPRLPFSNGYYGGTLTAPLTSPNSHLLIVQFNGQFIAMDHDMRIYTLRLAPRLGLREISTEWCSEIEPESFVQAWLVVCGDDLLMVDHVEM